MSSKLLIVFSLVAVLLAACGPELVVPAASPVATLESTPMPTQDTRPRSPGAVEQPAQANPEQLMAAPAIADLAARLGIPADQITVVEAKQVTWPDASLGCPAPDKMYAQVLTDGIQVVLQANGQTYDYRGRTPADVFLCGPNGPMPAAAAPDRGPVGSGTTEAIVKSVIADMTQKTGVAESGITVVSVEQTNWPTSGLGCEKPGEMYLQVITPGYQIVLSDGNTVYTYHTDARGRFVLCSQAMR